MNTKKIIAVLMSIVCMTTACAPAVPAKNANGINELISQYRKDTGCKNVSAVVYDNGDISYYGNNESLYQIGSMTKAFTGLAVQKLMCDGYIREDGIISDYIPGFEAYFGSRKADITVNDLLEQKSGYTNNENNYPSASEDMTLSEWAAVISGRELNSSPGTEYAYSNVNYNLLGLVIENVSGMTYRDYMENEILIPLGLRNTFAGMPENSEIAEGTRLGYRQVFDYPLPVREASVPAGYFYSNTQDMGRWIEIWIGSTEHPLKDAVTKVRAGLDADDYYSGWEHFPEDITGHSGGTPNYSSRIVFSENRQIGVCVLSSLNVASTTDGLCNGILDIVSGRTPGALPQDIWTIFDIIFTAVTISGILILVFVLLIKHKTVIIVLDAVLIILFASVLILFPVIFGADIRAIVFTWAPWSLAGGLLTVAADIAAINIKLCLGKNHADHNKTSKGQTSYGHNRIPRV